MIDITENQLKELLDSVPPNEFVIRSALERCVEIIDTHNRILCTVSGGSDSDVCIDMIMRCGGGGKTDFVFFDTGLEYEATKKHLDHLENKYNISIKRYKPKKSIPACVDEYGVPFISKNVSDMIYRLQSHNFEFCDGSFDELIKKYPTCVTALKWWCSLNRSDLFNISRYKYLKDFMIKNKPPKISNKCCDYTKKKVLNELLKTKQYDLCCSGVRKAEGGIRCTAYKTCFSESNGSIDTFRPVFWFRDCDKVAYCNYYDVVYSDCYTTYGLKRTGCFGCPFGRNFEYELRQIENFEPRLSLAANNIFGESYEYRRKYIEYVEQMKLTD